MTYILSIDPGYERLGIAILEKDNKTKNIKIIHSECFRTSSDEDFLSRLFLIGKKIEETLSIYKAKALAIENIFLHKNQKTAMKISEIRGVILYIAKKNNLSIYEYTPLQIKSAVTGSGKADKTSVQKMLLLQIEIPFKNKDILDDEYDAIACGLTCFALEKTL